MDTGPQHPKLWRSIKKERAPSIDSSTSSVESYTFGMDAPIVDFFDQDYITKFAPLEDILRGKADEIMEEAYKKDPTEDLYFPRTSSGYNFRWIHIPANNMIWVEVGTTRLIFAAVLFIDISDRSSLKKCANRRMSRERRKQRTASKT